MYSKYIGRLGKHPTEKTNEVRMTAHFLAHFTWRYVPRVTTVVCQHILFLVVIIAEPGEYNIQYTCLVYILEELCILVCVYYCKRDGCYEKPHYNGEFTLF